MNESNHLICSFCGKNQHDVRKLIAGPAVYICDECIRLSADILKEEMHAEEKPPFGMLTPHQIKARLDAYVIDQLPAKKIISVAVYNHYKRLDSSFNSGDVEIQKRWNGLDDQGKNIASGVYLYRMQSGNFTQTKKMIKLQ